MCPVLLIDELGRADEPIEAFLLEVLSDFQSGQRSTIFPASLIRSKQSGPINSAGVQYPAGTSC